MRQIKHIISFDEIRMTNMKMKDNKKLKITLETPYPITYNSKLKSVTAYRKHH
jgi:hypothetical protein